VPLALLVALGLARTLFPRYLLHDGAMPRVLVADALLIVTAMPEISLVADLLEGALALSLPYAIADALAIPAVPVVVEIFAVTAARRRQRDVGCCGAILDLRALRPRSGHRKHEEKGESEPPKMPEVAVSLHVSSSSNIANAVNFVSPKA
jgi:hypothetical protein